MQAIRQQYDSYGIDQYYQNHSDNYLNPHTESVIECINVLYEENRHRTVFDFACGDGLISKWIGTRSTVIGCDAYMHKRYKQETNNPCYNLSFNDFINFDNKITDMFDLSAISYAIDLIPNDICPMVLYRLALISKELIVIRPNNHIISSPYWELVDYIRKDKSKATLYKSLI